MVDVYITYAEKKMILPTAQQQCYKMNEGPGKEAVLSVNKVNISVVSQRKENGYVLKWVTDYRG